MPITCETAIMSNFIEDCIRGRALLDDIDDYVDQWHQHTSKLELNAYLGMSKAEYSLWVSEPEILPFIVTAHKENRDVSEIVDEISALPLAARSGGLAKAAELISWLKSQGLWK
jgi:hypothetical protein